MYELEDSEGIVILRHIVDEYAKKSREWGFYPVLMIHASIADLEEPGVTDKLADYAGDAGVMVISVPRIMRSTAGSAKSAILKYIAENGHYSAEGNAVIARDLASVFSLLKAEKYSETEALVASMRAADRL